MATYWSYRPENRHKRPTHRLDCRTSAWGADDCAAQGGRGDRRCRQGAGPSRPVASDASRRLRGRPRLPFAGGTLDGRCSSLRRGSKPSQRCNALATAAAKIGPDRRLGCRHRREGSTRRPSSSPLPDTWTKPHHKTCRYPGHHSGSHNCRPPQRVDKTPSERGFSPGAETGDPSGRCPWPRDRQTTRGRPNPKRAGVSVPAALQAARPAETGGQRPNRLTAG